VSVKRLKISFTYVYSQLGDALRVSFLNTQKTSKILKKHNTLLTSLAKIYGGELSSTYSPMSSVDIYLCFVSKEVSDMFISAAKTLLIDFETINTVDEQVEG
jgi:hypothetical protein